MSTKDQFDAAVNVIRGLPKDGPFQPSQTMMKKFYGLYKQATDGDCNISKPPFWDVIKKAKFEAWNNCRGMSTEQAMTSYVNELKKIVETMSFSADVATFMEVLGPFYEYVQVDTEDNEDTISDSGIELGNGFSSTCRPMPDVADIKRVFDMSGKDGPNAESTDASEDNLAGNGVAESGSSDSQNYFAVKVVVGSESDDDDDNDNEDVYQDADEEFTISSQGHDVDQAYLREAVEKLNANVQEVVARLSDLERASPRGRFTKLPCSELSMATTIFMLLWPFMAQGLYVCIKSWRRQ